MLKGFRDFLLKGDLITAAVGLVMALATFVLTEAKTRPCPECATSISVAARRCPSCTAVVIPESL